MNTYFKSTLFVALACILVHCSPKTTDVVKTEMPEKVEQTVQKVKTFRSERPAPGPAPEIQVGSYESFEAANGLKVIVVKNNKIPRVSYNLSLDLDGWSEGALAGTGDIAGDLLSKGTSSMTKAKIDESIDFIGARFNTGSSNIFGSSLTRHTDKLLKIMSEVLLNPAFPQAEFDKIKKQTISGLQTQKDDPNAIAGNIRRVINFGKDHPYGELTTETTVEAISLDDCKAFYNKYWKPNIAYLVVVGDTNLGEVKANVNKYFSNWKRGDDPRMTFAKPAMNSTSKLNFVHKPGAVQSVIGFSHIVDMEPGHPDAIKASVMNTLLGGYFGSRINQNLREKNGYTYGARSSLSPNRMIGNLNAGGSVRNEVTDSAMTELLYEINKLRNEPVTPEDLQTVKNYMTGTFALRLERPETVANFARNVARYGLPADYYQKYLQKVASVSISDIQMMAQKYLRTDAANLIVVGDKKLADKLTQFAPNGKIDFYDIYGNYLEPIKGDGTVVDPKTVMGNYFKAIGGMDKLKSVKSMKQTASMDMMGQSVAVKYLNKAPNMTRMEMTMQGMTVMKQVFDGTKGYAEQMGQKADLEGDNLAMAKEQGYIFKELHFEKLGYKMVHDGMENVNGKNCHVVTVTSPEERATTMYYDMDSGLKVKEMSQSEGPGGQKMSISQEYDDYKEVNGIMFPHTMKLIGAGPAPMTMKTESIEVNVDIDDAMFN